MTSKLDYSWPYLPAIAVGIRQKLEELHPDIHIGKIVNDVEARQQAEHPILATKIRLHSIWLLLHILIVILGSTYTIALLK